MNRHHLPLIGAILCFFITFVVVPIAVAMGLSNPGYTAPTTLGLILLVVWARGIRRCRS